MADSSSQPVRMGEVVGMIATTVLGLVLTLWPSLRWLGLVALGVTAFYFAVSVGRWWEHRRLTSTPHLDFEIHEHL